MSDEAVTENVEKSRFELKVGGKTAVAEYRVQDDRLVLTHTEVPPEMEGMGIGSRLARGVFAVLRASGRKPVLACEFMASYAENHPEVM